MDSKKLKFESKYLFISVLCAASWHKYHSIKPKRTKTAWCTSSPKTAAGFRSKTAWSPSSEVIPKSQPSSGQGSAGLRLSRSVLLTASPVGFLLSLTEPAICFHLSISFTLQMQRDALKPKKRLQRNVSNETRRLQKRLNCQLINKQK